MYNDIYTGDPQDKRFFGIYRGVVVDVNDPNDQNRIKMLVPQLLGKAITGWAWPVIGMPTHKKMPYISVVDTLNQPAGAPGTPTPTNTGLVKSLSTVLEGHAIEVKNDNEVHFKYAGVYNLQFSTQFVSTNSSLHKVQIWIAKNGVAVPESAGQITLSGSGAANVPAWNYVISLDAGDYIQFYWATDSSNVYIATNPTAIDGAPHVPGVIFTATLAGGYTPIPGDGCWVMFEGGDPNFPLWLGAF
jgi:hypothetical protein